MPRTYRGAIEPVGNTPLVEVTNIEKKEQLRARLLVKLGYFNPAGGVKDRVGKAMIEDVEHTSRLRPGSVVIEPTSGNTGIGSTAVSAVKGYRMTLTMPDTMSVECRNILKVYGAEIVLILGEKGMSGATEKAEELAKEIPDSFIPGQFDNLVNPRAHMESMGPEIRQDTSGQVDIFAVPVGTRGTLTGTGTYLKEKNPNIKITAVGLSTPPVLSGGNTGPHKIQGIGAGFILKVLDTHICDEIITVDNKAPSATAKMLARTEGLLTGVSSEVVLYVATEVARRPKNGGGTIVVLLPNSGNRYCSTVLFVKQSELDINKNHTVFGCAGFCGGSGIQG